MQTDKKDPGRMRACDFCYSFYTAILTYKLSSYVQCINNYHIEQMDNMLTTCIIPVCNVHRPHNRSGSCTCSRSFHYPKPPLRNLDLQYLHMKEKITFSHFYKLE